MSVTTPQGFRAAGVAAGLKTSGNLDLAIVINDGPLDVGAAVYTSNRAQAAPIRWSRAALEQTHGHIRAIILNSGGANCFTGKFGEETTARTASEVAALLGTDPDLVQVCSTGLIGEGGEAFRAAILDKVPVVIARANGEGGEDAANAIITTDTHAKTASYVSPSGWAVGGMAKGAGMLAPGLATMLVVLTTDAVLTEAEAKQSLRAATSVTFDRLDSDGCMSTNDQVTLMASGAADVAPSTEEFTEALTGVCLELAMALLGDAEGSSHDIAIRVVGAASVADALEVGRSVARNNLFKAAIFGNDPNWGRILAAVGVTGAQFDAENIDVSMNGVRICSKGGPDRPRTEVDLTARDVDIEINLFSGPESATIWTNDLTHDYVHENSAYSS